MEIELIEIRDFLALHHPFDRLPQPLLDQLPKRISVRYLRRGSPFPPPEDEPCISLIRQGAAEFRDAEGHLQDHLAEGELCITSCSREETTRVGVTSEDTLVYQIPCSYVDSLKQDNPAFRELLDKSREERLRAASQQAVSSSARSESFNAPVRTLLRSQPIYIAPQATIQQAAARMSEARVSSLLVMEGELLAGIVTLRDMRSRCLAVGLPYDRPVAEIMTTEVETIDADAPSFQAALTMSRLNLHHLPVTDGQRILGLVSSSDLVRRQSTSPVYLVSDIHKAADIATMVRIAQRIPELQLDLAHAGTKASQIAQAVSAVTDALTKRLLQLAEAELGAPPVPYVWVAGGSQARREQTARTDQDNALILDDRFQPEHDEYFAALAKFVCDGLNACGYVYCPGDVMATNPEWRQPQSVWRGYFRRWIDTPQPKALMLASVFFDLRAIAGDSGLLATLMQEVLQKTKGNGIFLAYMISNALKHRPPLGFFRNLVMIRGGEHDKTLDLKHTGLVPIVDLARVQALAAGSPKLDTMQRLQVAVGSGVLSSESATSMVDAYEYLATLRIQHQTRRILAGLEPDNFLPPEDLSALERGHLKDVFGLIATVQESLGQRYQSGRFV